VDPNGAITEGTYLNVAQRPLPQHHAVVVITEVLDCFWFNAIGVQARLVPEVEGAVIYYLSGQGETTLFEPSIGVVVPIAGEEEEVTIELYEVTSGRVLRRLIRRLRPGDYEVWTTVLPFDP
jgi:hypothetical protein